MDNEGTLVDFNSSEDKQTSQSKTCKQCGQDFVIEKEDLEFYKKISPKFAGKIYEIPAPNHCPNCRLQKRLAYRHGGKFFSRTCDLSSKPIISMYSPKKPFKVYEHDEWWSDKWDALSFGKDFDFSRPFFDQLNELFEVVPHASLANINAENSYYCNMALNSKNCYLLTGASNNENCMYGYFITSCKDTVDSGSLTKCQFCYEGLTSSDCYNCKFFANSRSCSDCFVIEDCQSCQNCIGCFGLRNKQYYIYNENVGKQKYEEFVANNLAPITHDKIDKIKSQFNKIKMKLPHRQSYIYASENCSGDMVLNSKNCHYAFASKEGEDSKFIFSDPKAQHSYDCSFASPVGTQYSYYTISTLGTSMLFTWFHWYGDEGLFTMECHNCDNCFACVGLRRKQYCIFNKQYTKEEYEKLAGKIIEHMQETDEWGEFYPMKHSMHSYDESLANDFFPLDKDSAKKAGFEWSDYVPPKPNISKIIKSNEVPEDINHTDNSIVNMAIECEVTGWPFMITPNEFAFYKQTGLPIPRKHPEQRHKERMAIRNAIQLWNRKCQNCQKDIKSIYKPDRKEIVFCETCYQKSIL